MRTRPSRSGGVRPTLNLTGIVVDYEEDHDAEALAQDLQAAVNLAAPTLTETGERKWVC